MFKILRIFAAVMLSVCLARVLPSYAGPWVKVEPPLSGGAVQLQTDYDQDGIYQQFFIMGVGYSPVPIGRAGVQWGGTNIFDDEAILRRDFQLLHDMHANTIRLWKADNTNNSKNEFPTYLTVKTLDLAEEYGLKVIPGFWVGFAGYWQCGPSGREFVWDEGFFDLDTKQIRPSVRADILARWQVFVNEFKSHPAVLFWAIGNENNLQLGKDPLLVEAFYALINEMALLAHSIDPNHPVAFINGGVDVPVIVEEEEVNTFPYITSYVAPEVDIWGLNVYQGNSFGDLFERFHQDLTPGLPLWISEFGIDAWHSIKEHPDGGYEDQDAQAEWVGLLWDEILDGEQWGVIGGTSMEYADEWWKPYQWLCQVPGWQQWWRPWWEFQNNIDTMTYPCGVFNDSHDLYGVPPLDTTCDGQPDWFPPSPDQFFNEEWWGIMAVEKNLTPGEPDVMIPRKVYGVLQEKFLKGPGNAGPVLDELAAQVAFAGQMFSLNITAVDPDQDTLGFSIVRDNGEPVSTLGVVLDQTAPAAAELVWTPQMAHLGKVYGFVVTVEDPGGLSDQTVVSVSVELPAPVVASLEPASGMPGDVITVHGENFGVLLSDKHYNPAADFNHDGVIDYSDFQIFYASYGRGEGDPGFEAPADFNRDGVVNYTDMTLFINHYRSSANGTYVQMAPVSGPSARIVSWSNTEIVCVVPPFAQAGPLTVRTPYGSSNELHFAFGSVPVIDQMTPLSGTPGSQVIVSGSGLGTYDGDFNYNPQADFNDDGIVDMIDFNQLSAAMGLSGVYRPEDLNHDGDVDADDSTIFYQSWLARRGSRYIRFEQGGSARILSWNDSQIVFQAPYFAQSGRVFFVTPSQQTGIDIFTVNRPPVILQIEPAIAGPETMITMTGLGFGAYESVGKYNPACDLDHDRDVDYQDFQIWFARYNTALGDSRYKPEYDFNHDGVINYADLNFFVQFYRSSRGISYVFFAGGVEGRVLTWSDTRIVCEVPYFAKSGNVYVIADGAMSNATPLSVE